MSGSTFNILIDLLRPRMEKRDTNFREAIPIERRIAIALWRLAMEIHIDECQKCFLLDSQHQMKSALFCRSISEMVNHFIKFPETRVERKNAIEEFKLGENFKIPMVVGALDGTTLQLWLRIMKIRLTTTIENNDTV